MKGRGGSFGLCCGCGYRRFRLWFRLRFCGGFRLLLELGLLRRSGWRGLCLGHFVDWSRLGIGGRIRGPEGIELRVSFAVPPKHYLYADTVKIEAPGTPLGAGHPRTGAQV